jgi:hypothetical protein
MRRFVGYWLVLQLLAIAAGIRAGSQLFDAVTG